jgi:hypothetical protein
VAAAPTRPKRDPMARNADPPKRGRWRRTTLRSVTRQPLEKGPEEVCCATAAKKDPLRPRTSSNPSGVSAFDLEMKLKDD